MRGENFDTLNFACAIMSACACAHTNNLQAPPTTSWKVTCAIGETKCEIFVPRQSSYESLAKIFASENFVVYGIERYTYERFHNTVQCGVPNSDQGSLVKLYTHF